MPEGMPPRALKFIGFIWFLLFCLTKVALAGVVAPSTSTLATSVAAGQATLSWSSAGDDDMTGDLTGIYRIQYATYTATWNTGGTPTNATTVTIATTSITPGSAQSKTIANLVGGTTYYFVLWTQDESNNWSNISNTTSAVAGDWFDTAQIEVGGATGGLYVGNVVWGDFDNDGDLDILENGLTAGNSKQLRVYKNNGNGTFDASQIEVDSLNGGLYYGGVSWGDFDNDGDLDILVSGLLGSKELRVYQNNGNGTINSTEINVDGAGGGLYTGGVAWGDFDNDGDFDILTSGIQTSGSTTELRIYKNNGNRTFNPSQIEVDGAGGGLSDSGVTWGDFDNDGDLDVLTSGTSSGSTRELRVYKNNGNGSVDATQIDVDGTEGIGFGAAWGDFDNDGDLDILAMGTTTGNTKELRVYKNNGNGTIDATQIEVDGAGGGLNGGNVAWGDLDNNGTLDVLASGLTIGNTIELRVYKNNGNGTLDTTQIEVDGAGGGLRSGSVAWGDFDSDGDLDILVNGKQTSGSTNELRVYKNLGNLVITNTAPTAPVTLTGTFSFSPTTVSIASMTWNAGTDSGTGATPENVLTYDLQISTTSNFSKLMFPGQLGASPRMGSYLKPPKIFNGNADYGVVLKSTDPWNTQATASYGLRTDTTYYYRVKTVDAGLAESGWSSAGTLFAGASPSTSTLSATAGVSAGQVDLTWNSAGDDGMIGNLSGNYQIQYATFSAVWNIGSTPANASTLNIPATNVVPGVVQSTSIAGLTPGTTYYFSLFTQDDATNWSGVSNTASAVAGAWFDTAQIEVDGANNGLRYGSVAWGDFDNDGDPDILTSGSDGTNKQLRVYKNNGNGTIDPVQIEVDGASGGLQAGGVAWGDFDNDGDLDILASGTQSASGELRIYKNNGNATFNATQIEVEAINAGLVNGHVAWGDFDNDGDLDVLANGGEGSTLYQLRVYKNNGNGTMDSTQIEVESRDAGLRLGSVVWGDFENDGDLDILSSGMSSGSARQLRIYKNNGNGSFDATQIEVDGLNNGLSNSSVNWGDFDTDGDLDIVVSGYDGTNRQLRVYKNNGNGTIDAAQIEMDSLNGGLDYSDAAWGDFDNDGDLDMAASGYDGANRQLRVYKNNGDTTFDASQIEVDGANGGLQEGGVAWADFDADSDLDILASGYDGASNQLRIYKNLSAVANTAPSAPATLTASWDYSATGLSTATFKWVAGVDNGSNPTAENGLTYQVEISTTSGFTGKSFVPGQWATPGMGNYLKPPKIYDGNTTHGVGLRYLPMTNTTYYYRVKTIDAGLKESAWSATGSFYTLVASSAPSVVTDFSAGEFGEGQIGLTWTAPLNIQSGSNPAYDIRYSTTGAITNDTEFNNATAVAGEPTPGASGTPHLMGLTELDPLKTYYFGIKSTNDNGTSPLDIASPRPSAVASPFNATQIEVDGLNGGPQAGTVAWGDFDIDGNLDILVSGTNSSGQLRVYKNNGNGTFDAAQIEVDGVNNGLYYGATNWGDLDNDGDLDILVSGYTGSTNQLRVYKNNGNGTIDPTQIEVEGLDNGLRSGGVAWGDFDNDGDLDIVASGTDGTNGQLRVYKNNGNGTINPNQIEVDGLNGGLSEGSPVWGDFDKDGDADILVNGTDGTNPQLRVYKNNGDGTFDGEQIEIDGANNGMRLGGVAWGDFDGDGDLDILGSGINTGFQLRVYKNNGNGAFDPSQIELDGLNGGLDYSSVSWGDYDNDGDLDVLTTGYRGNTKYQLEVYNNNGNGTFSATQIEVDGLYGGLSGSVSWGDSDSDGDLDILANGSDSKGSGQLRVYTNFTQTANTAPAAPSTLSGAFAYDPAGVSIASMTWNAGTDSGTGATPENVLTYDLQISTVSNFSTLLFPGQLGASPRMGSYLKPPKIFNGNANYGVVLKSTDPWNTQPTASYGLRTDTTYYYRVKTVDSALAESGWSTAGTLDTGVTPSTSTLSAVTGASAGQVALSWNSAGDDGMLGNLTGNYWIQYATYSAVWSTGSAPAHASTLTIPATNVVSAVVQSTSVAGLMPGTLYYFALFTQDEGSNWSDVSNTVSALPLSTVSLVEAVGQPGWIGQGETQRILGTAQVVSDSATGVTVSSVAVRETGAYTGDGNLTNVEVWVSSSGYIDATAVRLDDTSKSFSGDIVAFDQDVTVSTTPLYFIARADVSGSATEGTFEISMQAYTLAATANNPIAFTNATDVVAPPSGNPSGLTATAASNLLQVNLTWGSASGADTYTIYRATYSGVTTTDFLLGMTNATSFADDYIPPAQQMYYKVIGANRAGASGASGAANATSVDVPALTTSNIYLRAGIPGPFGDGNMAFLEKLKNPLCTFVDRVGNIFIADTDNNRIRFMPKMTGTYFGQAMTANYVYTIAGNGTAGYVQDGVAATSTRVNVPNGVAADADGNVYISDKSNHRIRFVPKASGTHFGVSMTANYIYTIAGNGTGGYVADNVAATSTQINQPTGVSVDAGGNVYIVDRYNQRIRLIPKTTGTYFGQSMTANYIYTIAGDGTAGIGANGVAATSTQIRYPWFMCVDAGGNVYISDNNSHRIRFIPRMGGTYFGQSMTANYIYTIAGNGGIGYGTDNVAATSTSFSNPSGVDVDNGGNVFIADSINHRIRFIPRTGGTYFGQSMTANYIYTIAGNGTAGYVRDGVAATATKLNTPTSVSVDGEGNVYTADTTNGRIRVVSKTGRMNYGQPMMANYIYTIAGNREQSSIGAGGGLASSQGMISPRGVRVDASGNMYFTEYANHRLCFVPKVDGTYFGQAMTANGVYRIAGNETPGFGGDTGLASSAVLNGPRGLAIDANRNIYVADADNNRIRFIPSQNGSFFGQNMTANYIYTIAGNGTASYGGNDGPAINASLNLPYGLAVDAAGNIYIADAYNEVVRFIPVASGTFFGQSMTANYIYTIAGGGVAGGDGVLATSANLGTLLGLDVDAGGNVYVPDLSFDRVWFIPKSSGTYFGQSMTANYIYTIIGNGIGGFVTDGVLATTTKIDGARGISVDGGGNVYFSDGDNNRIRFVPKKSGTYFGQSMTGNFIYTIGGNGGASYTGENSVAPGKSIYLPIGVCAGPDHMVYFTDENHKIRMIAGEDFIQPSTSTLAVATGVEQATLSWTSAGDDNVNLGNLTGTYRIQYATYTATWSTGSTPTNATTVTISTTNAVPGSAQSYVAGSLMPGNTYYFALFTADEVPNWSDVSNTASAWLDGTAPSTSTLVAVPGSNMGEINLSWASAGDDGMAGNLTGNYRIQYATYTVAWSTSSTPTDATTVTIATTSAVPGSAEATTISSLTGGTTYYFVLWSQDESNNWSNISNVPSTYATGDVTAPSTSTLAAVPGSTEGKIDLSWNSAGDDGMTGNLTGNYRIQYATYTVAWSTSSTPTDATTVTIATTAMVPGSAQATTISSLTGGTTYYFVLWSQDESSNWSNISNVPSTYATNDVTAPSTSTLAAVPGAIEGQINLSWTSAGDDGSTGNLTGNYRIQYATFTAVWSAGGSPADVTTLTISTTNTVPGSAQATTISSLTGGTTYYFVLWSQDESSNWSGLSNTASAPATVDVAAPSTSTLTAVTGTVDGGIDLTWASAGDDGMTGNLTGAYRIQYATYTVSWSTSSTPTDATTLTLSAAGVAPGAIQSTSVVVGMIQSYYFVIWTQDDGNNWSVISGTASAMPFLGIRSVTIISGTPLALGVVNLGTQVVTSTGVVVRNNGTLPSTYIMRASTQTPGTTWSVKDSTPAAPDALVFYGAYDGATAPAESDFEVEDVIGPAYQQCTGTRYTVAGAITGDNVPAGEDRTLWIRLDMPTTTRTTDTQALKIEITAQPP